LSRKIHNHNGEKKGKNLSGELPREGGEGEKEGWHEQGGSLLRSMRIQSR